MDNLSFIMSKTLYNGNENISFILSKILYSGNGQSFFYTE